MTSPLDRTEIKEFTRTWILRENDDGITRRRMVKVACVIRIIAQSATQRRDVRVTQCPMMTQPSDVVESSTEIIAIQLEKPLERDVIAIAISIVKNHYANPRLQQKLKITTRLALNPSPLLRNLEDPPSALLSQFKVLNICSQKDVGG
jgi:hypothetical protein